MVNAAPPPRGNGSRRIRAAAALGLLAGLVACARDMPGDAPADWWHQLEGGAIARQRPPPPGVNDPYPYVGTVPAHPPQVASAELRRTVTADLQRQRDVTQRLDAATPLPPPAPPPPPRTSSSSASGQAGSATLDAAQAAPRTGAPAASPQAMSPQAMSPQAALPATAADGAPPDELALPPVTLRDPGGSDSVTLPGIPAGPPPLPQVAGVPAAAGAPSRMPVPDYGADSRTGTRIAFAPGSDTLLDGQSGALHALAAARGGGRLRVVASGDATSAEPAAQAHAIAVASLRARSLARALQAEGVPAADILLRAKAFGRDASVTLLQ